MWKDAYGVKRWTYDREIGEFVDMTKDKENCTKQYWNSNAINHPKYN